MSKVIIVTDSTTYIPNELQESFKLEIAPLVVLWDDNQYRDGVDITPSEFYEKKT